MISVKIFAILSYAIFPDLAIVPAFFVYEKQTVSGSFTPRCSKSMTLLAIFVLVPLLVNPN
ncbi:MAG: hypothetical protein IPM34_07690 [Saprospiraceae bacterium]|nr:hypothetical protein [Saprospiraceae bacterium]